MAIKKKYIFTQLSGLFIAIIVCFSVSKLTAYLFPQVFRDQRIVSVSIFILVLLIIIGFSMRLWARVLVLCGILKREEAKGFPFSKPWEEPGRQGKI
jgi:hypothetical protein